MRIIAKSDGTTLLKHTGRVYFAAKQILNQCASNIFRLFKIAPEQQLRFVREYLVCSLAHDLGKANSEFYLFFNKQIDKQGVRHEHISAYIVHFFLKEWLEGCGINPYTILSVVLGHHLKSPEESTEDYPKFGESLLGDRACEIYLSSYDINRIIKFIGNEIGSKAPVGFRDVMFESFDSKKIELECDKLDKTYIFALKVLLIWADTLGSAEFENISMREWIAKNLGSKPNNFDEFLSGLKKERKVKTLNNVQLNVSRLSKSTKRLAVVANCGSGKTFAELYFAKHYITNHGYSGIVHITPTKGLVNEVYLKYFRYSGNANIFHSQRIYSLKSMNIDLEDKRDIGELLLNLGSHYNAATPDQILSSFIYNRKGILLLMLLLNSVVVFDELHNYDSRMISFFVKFCNKFDIPIIVMSATTSPDLVDVLHGCGFKIIPNPNNTFAKSFRTKRYNISYQENFSYKGLKLILEQGFNIALVIVNTVNRCREISRRLEDDGLNVICYHSRYRFIDRVAIANSIEAIERPTVIVSTQVLEMGIDLDADLFVSEMAPITSLIQRLGRTNRKQDTNTVSNCYLFQPVNCLPYSDEDIKIATELIRQNQGLVSYFDLSICLNNIPSSDFQETESCFSINPMFSFGRDKQFREPSVPTVNCFEHNSVPNIIKAIQNKQPLDSFYVPVPFYNLGATVNKFPPVFNKLVDKVMFDKFLIKRECYDRFGYCDGKDVLCFYER